MVRHNKRTHKRGVQSRRRRRSQRGRGYGFGGSILSDAGGANAGSPMWNNVAGSDCGMPNRGGNNTLAGGRRRRRKTRRIGGMSALQQPRAGYTFTGEGVAGTADTVPAPSYTTPV